MITNLTEEQKAKFSEYVKTYTDIGLTTNNHITLEEASSIIAEVYKKGGLKPPKQIIMAESPFAAINIASEKGVTQSNIRFCYGAMDSPWISYYEYFRKECKLKKETDAIQGLVKALRLGWFIPLRGLCIISQHPIAIHRDDRGRLHKEDGMSVEYSDGFGLYTWKGVRLNRYGREDHYSWIITNPEKITFDVINRENNAEIKRIMIEKVGYEEYLKMGNASPIDKSSRGELFEINLGEGMERAKVVKVENSTINPDGSRDIYFIPVHPSITTADEAVASTFPIIKKYNPIIET